MNEEILAMELKMLFALDQTGTVELLAKLAYKHKMPSSELLSFIQEYMAGMVYILENRIGKEAIVNG